MIAELFFKSCVVLIAAAGAAWLLRRGPAAWRHLIWSAAIAAVLVLPAFALLLPGLHVRSARVQPVLQQIAPAAAAPAAPRVVKVVRMDPPAPERTIDYGRIALLLWISGAIALLLRAGIGELQVRRIAARAKAAVDREWLEPFRDALAGLDLAREVKLLASEELTVPVTFGVLKPVVLVPAVRDWSPARRRSALLHELAHVERFDALTQLLARVVCAVHWPNPLVHLAARAMRMERERACDDRALECGARPSEYADSLLQIAREARGAALALSMARPSQLEGRVLSVLDPLARRGRARARSAATVCSAALALAAPLAAVRAQPPPPPPAPPPPATSHIHQDDDHSTFSYTDDHTSVQIVSQGKIAFDTEGRDIVFVAPGGYVQITTRQGSDFRVIEMHAGPDGRLVRSMTVNGAAAQWDDAWWQTELTRLERDSGFGAPERAKALLASRGPDGVLDEAAQIKSDYARGLYLKAANERSLSKKQIVRMLELTSSMSSAYEKGQVLRAVAAHQSMEDAAVREAFANAAAKIDSDYERSQTLQVLLQQPNLSHEVARTALAAAAQMSSDYEKANVLIALANRKLLDADLMKSYVQAAASINSDYEKSRVLQAALAAGKLDEESERLALAAVGQIHSDYEAANVIVAMANRQGVTPSLRQAYQDAAMHIQSDYERGRAFTAIGMKSGR